MAEYAEGESQVHIQFPARNIVDIPMLLKHTFVHFRTLGSSCASARGNMGCGPKNYMIFDESLSLSLRD